MAVVTGASTGIGYELARLCARENFDLIVIANEPRIFSVAEQFRSDARGDAKISVEPIETDLSRREGTDEVLAVIADRPVSVLIANAATGLGRGFIDQDFEAVRRTVSTNITETLHLIHAISSRMRQRRSGRILITGSIAGLMPGPFNAVYNASKAFINSFSWALRNELQDTGVSVTCLMPGATETEFFERAGMQDTKIGQSKKDDPASVAEIGFRAMMRGDGDVISGWHNKVQAALANVSPASSLAQMHRKMAEPGSASKSQASS